MSSLLIGEKREMNADRDLSVRKMPPAPNIASMLKPAAGIAAAGRNTVAQFVIFIE